LRITCSVSFRSCSALRGTSMNESVPLIIDALNWSSDEP
jgi:hypothetical protein